MTRKEKNLGSIISDSLIVQERPAMHWGNFRRKAWWRGTGRMLVVSVGFWVGLFILVARLFQLTVIDGHRFRALADSNRTRELTRHAPRGKILDRSGVTLVDNIPRFRLLSPCKDNQETLCISRLEKDEGEKMQASGLPANNFLEVDYRRSYLYPESTAHVVGYTGEISPQELSDSYYQLRQYKQGDFVGRTAAEAVYEENLRGRDGRELVEVDAMGKITRVLGRDPELPGDDIQLSIDADLSEATKKVFPQNRKGAVIISKPDTGEILTMYSSPTFSLNDFSQGLSPETYQKLVDDPNRPFLNRAIGGSYPPGSTYKIIGAVAGLEEGAITKSTNVEDTGLIKIGPFEFPNWYYTQNGKTDGMVNVVRGLARSNDIFFYKTGEALGVTKLDFWSKKFGLGNVLGIELPGEESGLLPSPDWKKTQFTSLSQISTRQDDWYLGDTYHMAIGQGFLLTTPLQVNAWTNVIADHGRLCTPTIQKINARGGPLTIGPRNGTCKDLGISDTTIAAVTEGMREACSQGGTAYPLFGFSVKSKGTGDKPGEDKIIPVACKTGTAEYGDPNNHTHAWITLFAPIPETYLPTELKKDPNVLKGDPELSMTILVEEAGEGSDVAGPIAKELLTHWFSR